jgi:hypothetical protein
MPLAASTAAALLAALLAAAPPQGAPAKRARAARPAPAAQGGGAGGPNAAKPAGKPLPALARPGKSTPVPMRPVKAHPRAAGTGTVLYVTARRAYLDAGADAGLAPGARVELSRRGRDAGACTVETVSDRSATCLGQDLRAGDTFTVAATHGAEAVPARKAYAPPPLTAAAAAPLPDAAELARRRAAVEAAAVPKVEFKAAPQALLARAAPRVEASLVHASWFGGGAAGLHQERVEARIHGAELLPGFRLFLDASGVYRPSAAERRFRPGDSAYLEVRELQVASREPDRAYTLAVGRVLPWSAPGSTPFDGAQVGFRGGGGELGVFGGTVPDVLTTGLRTDRSTAGVYGALESASEAALLRGEGRLALVRSPELGTRYEAEALTHAWLGRLFDLSAQARLGFGDRTAPGSLDQARLDLGWRAAERLALSGSLRYVGLFVDDATAPAFFASPSRRADATVSFDATRLLVLRFTGGYAKDLRTRLDRGYAGPEVALPRLFGRNGGLAAGWLEERGWAGGRSVWLQGDVPAPAGVRLFLRGTFFMDQRPAPLSDENTVGLTAAAAKDLLAWLRFRVSGMARLGVSGGEGANGVSVLAALDGLY